MSSRQNLQVTPSNHTSTGKISYRDGNPLIQFIIGEQDRMLIGQSVRFVGKFSAYKNSAKDIPATTDSLRMSEQLGLYSIIDSLIRSSKRFVISLGLWVHTFLSHRVWRTTLDTCLSKFSYLEIIRHRLLVF